MLGAPNSQDFDINELNVSFFSDLFSYMLKFCSIMPLQFIIYLLFDYIWLQEIESLLQCGICFEPMTTAMMAPSCSHNCRLCLYVHTLKCCLSCNFFLFSFQIAPYVYADILLRKSNAHFVDPYVCSQYTFHYLQLHVVVYNEKPPSYVLSILWKTWKLLCEINFVRWTSIQKLMPTCFLC